MNTTKRRQPAASHGLATMFYSEKVPSSFDERKRMMNNTQFGGVVKRTAVSDRWMIRVYRVAKSMYLVSAFDGLFVPPRFQQRTFERMEDADAFVNGIIERDERNDK